MKNDEIAIGEKYGICGCYENARRRTKHPDEEYIKIVNTYQYRGLRTAEPAVINGSVASFEVLDKINDIARKFLVGGVDYFVQSRWFDIDQLELLAEEKPYLDYQMWVISGKHMPLTVCGVVELTGKRFKNIKLHTLDYIVASGIEVPPIDLQWFYGNIRTETHLKYYIKSVGIERKLCNNIGYMGRENPFAVPGYGGPLAYVIESGGSIRPFVEWILAVEWFPEKVLGTLFTSEVLNTHLWNIVCDTDINADIAEILVNRCGTRLGEKLLIQLTKAVFKK